MAMRLGKDCTKDRSIHERRLSLRESCVEIATFAEQKATLGLGGEVNLTFRQNPCTRKRETQLLTFSEK